MLFIYTDEPEITVHPKSQTGIEGNNLILSGNASGNPVPTISWTKNGSSINTIDNYWIRFSEDNKQLIIMKLNRSDRGAYQCVANNSLGFDTSNGATLNVLCKYGILF